MKVLVIEESAWLALTIEQSSHLVQLCRDLRNEIQVVRMIPDGAEDLALDVLGAAALGGERHAADLYGARAYAILACASRAWTYRGNATEEAIYGARSWNATGLAVIGRSTRPEWTTDMGHVAHAEGLTWQTLRLMVASLGASGVLDSHLRDYGGLTDALVVARSGRT